MQGLAGNQCGLQGPYQVRHLCELIHTESAQTLATYRDDFYAGRPAVTVNGFGKGKAWHVASRNDLAFQRDFFAAPDQGAGSAAGDSDGVTTRRGGDCAHRR